MKSTWPVVVLAFFMNFLPTNAIKSTADSGGGFSLCSQNDPKYILSFCLNNAICYRAKTTTGDVEIYCKCQNGFSGSRCENSPETFVRATTAIQTTSQQHKCPEWYVCLNDGTCVLDLNSGPKCLCKDEFEGLNCGKFKICPNLNECKLDCAFGLKKKFGCTVCECNCLNEYNYFNELKNFDNSNKMNCNKNCVYGFEKDQNECFKCECLTFPTFALNAQNMTINDLVPETVIGCNAICKNEEICKQVVMQSEMCKRRKDLCSYEDTSVREICVPELLNDKCILPLDSGNCTTSTKRSYFFDIQKRLCKPFIYTGCGGNLNRFDTVYECITECESFFTNTSTSQAVSTTLVDTINNGTASDPMRLSTTFCKWSCDSTCEFGFKMNPVDDCYICECLDLNLTECGIPCYLTGTYNCSYASRANSRPLCVCKDSFSGIYCEKLIKSTNFSMKFSSFQIQIDENLDKELKRNFTQQFSQSFSISQKQMAINQIRIDGMNILRIDFSLYGMDYSNLSEYDRNIEDIKNQLNKSDFKLAFSNQIFTLHLECKRNDELVQFDIDEKYLYEINKLKKVISDLKDRLRKKYSFGKQSIQSIKVLIEPKISLEFQIKNNEDSMFCANIKKLIKDIRGKSFIGYQNRTVENRNSNSIQSVSAIKIDRSEIRASDHAVSEAQNIEIDHPFWKSKAFYATSIILIGFICALILTPIVLVYRMKRSYKKPQQPIAIPKSTNFTNKFVRTPCPRQHST